jgi:hypothetical protein
LKLSYQLPSNSSNNLINNNRIEPIRAAPLPPIKNSNNGSNSNTLSSHYHQEFAGVTFELNSKIVKQDFTFELPKHSLNDSRELEYDFNLERQILCSTKDEKRKSTNPFF